MWDTSPVQDTTDEFKGGMKMRKAKIVDIKENVGQSLQDPYGNWHEIPEKAEFKINSIRDRGIEIKEIKWE